MFCIFISNKNIVHCKETFVPQNTVFCAHSVEIKRIDFNQSQNETDFLNINDLASFRLETTNKDQASIQLILTFLL